MRLYQKLKNLVLQKIDGSRVVKKARGFEYDVYDMPEFLGTIEMARGRDGWESWVWLPEQYIRDTRAILGLSHPIYMELTECKESRHRRLFGVSFQTIHPDNH